MTNSGISSNNNSCRDGSKATGSSGTAASRGNRSEGGRESSSSSFNGGSNNSSSNHIVPAKATARTAATAVTRDSAIVAPAVAAAVAVLRAAGDYTSKLEMRPLHGKQLREDHTLTMTARPYCGPLATRTMGTDNFETGHGQGGSD
jgi:hypothetical protein